MTHLENHSGVEREGDAAGLSQQGITFSFEEDSNVYPEQVGLLYKNVLIGLAATLINSLLLGFVLSGAVSFGMIAAWLGCLLPVTFLRFLSILEYRQGPARSRTGLSWDTLFLVGATSAGAIWGSAGVLLFPEQSMQHQTFLVFVLGGMAAGGAVVYSPVKPVFVTFILLDLTPVIIRFYIEGERLYFVMGMMLTLFMVLMLFAGMQMHRVIVESLRLRFKNDALVAYLKAANVSSEELVEELQLAIAERERAEDARLDSERQFRMLVETMNEGLGVYDRTGTITYVNDRGCEISGYSRDEILGRNAFLFFGEANRALYEEQWDRRKRGERGLYEMELLGKDGRAIPVILSSSPIFDRKGEFDGAIVSITDISSLREARRAQRESESKYRLIFENSPQGVVHVNPDGMITACNHYFASMFGFRKEELIDRVRMTSFGCEGMRTAVRQCLSGSRRHHEGNHHLDGNGKDLIVQADFSPITAEDGSLSGCIGIVRDITERKQAERAQQASEKQLRLLSSRLLAAQEEERKRIAGELHDSIGSSLNAIKVGLQNSLSDAGGSTVRESVEPLLSMVQNTVDEVRRIMTDLRPSMLDDLGLIATVGWFCRQFQSIYSSIRIERTISVDEEEEIPDHLKIVIFRIMQEALNNIAKHSKADSVAVSIVGGTDGMELTISDNGVGFDMKEVGLRKDHSGCIGLSSMRERTELSGGTFSIESAVGRGTVIRASWKLQPTAQ